MPFNTAEMEYGNTSIKYTKFLVWLSEECKRLFLLAPVIQILPEIKP